MLPDDRDKLGEQLSAYLDGELSAAESAEIERLVATDPEARELLDALRRTVESVRELPRLAAPDQLFNGLTDRIERAQLLNGVPEATDVAGGGRWSRWGLVASAAVVVLAVGGGFWAFHEMTDSISRRERRLALLEEKAPDWAPTDTPDAAPGETMPEKGGVARQRTRRDVITDSEEPADDFATGRSEVRLGAKVELERVGAPDEGAVGRSEAANEALAPLDYGVQSTAERLVLERASTAERKPIAAGAATPVYPLETPLEEKLRQGIDGRGVREHRFANEAMRLDVSFASAGDRDRAQTQMNAFMLENSIQPLERTIADDTDAVPPSATFFVEGRPHLNFGESPDGAQVLVRLQAPELDAMVEQMQVSADVGMRLAVGDIVAASDPDRVRDVLQESFAGQFALRGKSPERHGGSAAGIAGARETSRRRGRATPPTVLKKMDALTPPRADKSAAAPNGEREAPTAPAEPADAASSGLTDPSQSTRPPAPDLGEGATTRPFAAEEIITLVINLRAPPPVSDADAPGPPGPPATTQPHRTTPAETQPAAADPQEKTAPGN